MKGYHKLRIDTKGDSLTLGGMVNVYLDGQQIYPSNLHLELESRSVPEVSISLGICELEISADALVALQAHVVD
jgi:hypothetical protein